MTRFIAGLARRWDVCLFLLVMAVAAAHVGPSVLQVHPLAAMAAGVSMALFLPVQSMTPAQIRGANTPPPGAGIRGTRGVYYDTQPYVSTTTLNLDFFTAINTDKSMSNQRANGGALPNGWGFLPYTMGVDVLGRGSVGANTQVGILDDIAQLVMSGRGFLQLKIGNFSLPEIPLSFLHGSGGPFGTVGATLTAPNTVQFGTNGVQDGGFGIGNSFMLTSDTPISLRLSWPAALTLNQTPLNLRFWFLGDWQTPIQG